MQSVVVGEAQRKQQESTVSALDKERQRFAEQWNTLQGRSSYRVMDDGSRAPILQQNLILIKQRATERAVSLAEGAVSNVMRSTSGDKIKTFWASVLMGFLFGNLVFYQFLRLAAFMFLAGVIYGIPSMAVMQAALESIWRNGLKEIQNFEHDVILGCGVAAGVIFCFCSLTNVAMVCGFYLVLCALFPHDIFV